MQFTKMHGCGNDYVVVDGRGGRLNARERGELARRLCARRFGVGADGLLILQVGSRAEFEMEMYNPDGSRGESCGNGLRCAAKYLRDRGWTDERQFTVETMGAVKVLEEVEVSAMGPGGRLAGGTVMGPGGRLAGGTAMRPGGRLAGGTAMGPGGRLAGGTAMRRDSRFMGQGDVSFWRVNMGIPVFGSADAKGNQGGWRKRLQGLKAYCVSMGNPHAVIFMEGEAGEWPVTTLGPKLERDESFPGRTNVEFVRVLDRKRVEMRVWERGAGETLACGTGACAAAAVCMQKHLTDDEITVTLLGGELMILRKEDTGEIFLTGPAETVFEGELRIET